MIGLFIMHATFLEAIHRFYESRRRLFNDDQPHRRERADEVKKCKKVCYQKKVYVMCFLNVGGVVNFILL